MATPAEQQAPAVVEAIGPDGQPVAVPVGELGQLVSDGRVSLGDRTEIGVRDERGNITTLRGADAAAYLASPESRYSETLTAEQVNASRKQAEWDTIGGAAKATALGALDTGTLGLGTAAGAYLSPEFGQTVRDAEHYAGGAYTVGQGLGLLPAIVATVSSGGSAAAAGGGVAAAEGAAAGAGLLGRAAATGARLLPSTLAAGAGQAAERAAGRALVGLGVEGSGILATGARVAAGQAVEQALYGAGEAVRNAALDNVDLTAERVLAGAGWGALSGAALGGALGMGGAILSKGASKAADTLSLLKSSAATKELEAAATVERSLARSETGARSLTDRLAREQALKSTGITTSGILELEKLPVDIQDRFVRMAVEDIPAMAGAREGELLSKARKSEAAQKLADKIGSERGALIKELVDAGAVVTPERALQRANANVELLSKMGGESAADAAKIAERWGKQIDDAIQKEGVEGVWRIRREMRDDIRKAVRADDALKRDALTSIRDSLDETLDEAAKSVNGRPDFALKWTETAREYTAAKRLQETLEKAATVETVSKVFGLTEALGTAATLASGGLAALPMAAAGTAASHIYKRYGADIGYQLARAAGRGELAAQVARLAEANLNKSLGGLVGDLARKGATGAQKAAQAAPEIARRTTAALPPIAREVDRQRAAEKSRKQAVSDEYQRAVAEVRRWRTNGGGAPGAREVFAGAPEPLVRAIEARTVAAGKALERAMPQGGPPPGATLQGHLESRKPSAAEMQKLVDTRRLIDDPGYVAQLAREGRLTPEHVATWREVQPVEYQRVRANALAELTALQRPLPYRQALQLSTLLDIPADPSTTPEFVAYSQGLFTNGVRPEGTNAAPSSLKPPAGGSVKTTVSFSQKLSGGLPCPTSTRC